MGDGHLVLQNIVSRVEPDQQGDIAGLPEI
jgi:hypothetical protein